MSDLSSALLMMAVVVAVAICVALQARRIHQLCDEIATGVVNGGPVSPTYRWLRLYCDYITNAAAISFMLLTVAIGFAVSSKLVDDSDLKFLAHLCGVVLGMSALINAALVIVWVVHLRSHMRRAESE
jgi:hypothetical protein